MPILKRCREKFHGAVFRLAVAEGDVRQRLRGAYRYLRQLSVDDVPPQHRDEFTAILKALTQRGAELGPDGMVWRLAIDSTLDHIRNSTGRRIAERIYRFAKEIDALAKS